MRTLKSATHLQILLRNSFFRATIWFFMLASLSITSVMVPANQANNTSLVRPLIYLGDGKIAHIRSRLGEYPYSKFWVFVKSKASYYAAEKPPVSVDSYDDDTIRQFGDRLPYMAMAFLITGEEPYLTGARKWMAALASYTDWASNKDLGAAHLLFGMSVAYNWLYDRLDPEERKIYQKKITRHADILYKELSGKKIWWAQPQSYLQGHNYANVMALAVAGLALHGENPDTKLWLDACRDNFRSVLNVLSPDGASHEGVGYWSYGMDSLLKYFMATAPIDGISDLQNAGYFKNAARYRLYMSMPGYKENVDYADSPRYDYSGPGHILRLMASLFHDGHAQWLAEMVEEKRDKNNFYSWLNLIWYDDSVQQIPPDDMPPFAYFNNLGILVSRSDWSDDATWAFFKTAPSQGFLAQRKGYYAGSHIHPDEGNFLLWGNREWLIVDDGYVFKKRSMNHNLLLFNGQGQLGEGKQWFDYMPVKKNAATANILHTDIQDKYQYIEGELSKLYSEQAGITSWKRTFVVLDGTYLVVHDDVMIKKEGIMIERLLHAMKGVKKTANGVYCLGRKPGFFVKETDPEKNESHLTSYSIPAQERNKDLGTYEGDLIDTKVTAIVGQHVKLTLVVGRVEGTCKAAADSITIDPSATTVSIRNSAKSITINFETQKVSFQ